MPNPSSPPTTAAPDPQLKSTRRTSDNDREYEHTKQQITKEIAEAKSQKQVKRAARRIKTTLNYLSRVLIPFRSAFRKQHLKKTLALTAVVAVLLISWLIFNRPNKVTPTQLNGEQVQTPTFATLEPDDDITKTKSGAIAFDASRNVASYTDSIADIGITLSQQPMPEDFKSDTAGKLLAFAANINANEKIEARGTEIYIGTSVKGPQTVVFIKDDKLFFIGADSKLPYDQLQSYIEALR